MSGEVDSNSGESSRRSLGVRFAESSVGKPIVSGLLFVAGSFWLSMAAISALILLVAIAMEDTVMAGIIGVFGVSGIAVGLFGYAVYLLYKYRSDSRTVDRH